VSAVTSGGRIGSGSAVTAVGSAVGSGEGSNLGGALELMGGELIIIVFLPKSNIAKWH